MLYNNLKNDTIAAVATASGKSGISIVRMSGPESISTSKLLFRGSKVPEQLDRNMVYGHIVDNGEYIDEVLMCVMKAPHSYTCEDIVEIHCHGGFSAASAILGKIIDRGVRLAEPGEFTKRAFLNGRIDLVQAESVMEIVTAEGREHLRRAERLMDGVFSKRIEKLLDELKQSLSLLELNIDFLHHGLEAIKKDELTDSIKNIIKTLDNMIVSYRTAKRIKDGIQVVIAGKVNAGKSSLFNALLGRKRAIVNASPGTTRDWLEEKIDFKGISINLIDTAGLRETIDEIEREGVSKSEHLLGGADIIIYLVESGEKSPYAAKYFKNRENVIRILSKSDLLRKKPSKNELIPVSTVTGEGFPQFKERLHRMLKSQISSQAGDSIVMVERHKIELQNARDALERALKSIDSWSEEVTALELREAQRHIEAILGRHIDLDVLETIFNNFCIGK